MILVEAGGKDRGYPLQILIWHKIIHYTLGDLPLDDVNFPPFLYDGRQAPDVLPPVARMLTFKLNDEAVACPYEILKVERACAAPAHLERKPEQMQYIRKISPSFFVRYCIPQHSIPNPIYWLLTGGEHTFTRH